MVMNAVVEPSAASVKVAGTALVEVTRSDSLVPRAGPPTENPVVPKVKPVPEAMVVVAVPPVLTDMAEISAGCEVGVMAPLLITLVPVPGDCWKLLTAVW
jgi:hypothetical protein